MAPYLNIFKAQNFNVIFHFCKCIFLSYVMWNNFGYNSFYSSLHVKDSKSINIRTGHNFIASCFLHEMNSCQRNQIFLKLFFICLTFSSQKLALLQSFHFHLARCLSGFLNSICWKFMLCNWIETNKSVCFLIKKYWLWN